MKRVLKIFNIVEEYLGSIILFIIFFDMILQVLTRLLPGNSIPWTLELGEIMLGALIWFGLGRGVAENIHIKFDILDNIISGKGRKFLNILGDIMFIIYLVLLSIFTVELLKHYYAYESRTTILGIPYYLVRMPIVIGAAASIIRISANIIKSINSIIRPDNTIEEVK